MKADKNRTGMLSWLRHGGVAALIRKAFAFSVSAAMLLAGLIGSGLVVPVYANTNVSD